MIAEAWSRSGQVALQGAGAVEGAVEGGAIAPPGEKPPTMPEGGATDLLTVDQAGQEGGDIVSGSPLSLPVSAILELSWS